MGKADKEEKRLARRQFLKGAAVGVAGVAAGGVLAGCGSEPTPGPAPSPQVVEKEVVKEVEVKPWLPEKWDRETDVVVVGYGFSGACAAIAAKDAGADVLILEKSATAEGGNSGCSTGSLHTYLGVDDPEAWIKMIKEHSWGTAPDDEAVRAYVADALQTKAWLEGLGMELQDVTGNPSAARAGGMNARMIWKNQRPDETRAAGMDVFAFENDVVTQKGIEILFSTPATELIQDPVTKEVLGVRAKTGVESTKWSPETPSCFSGGQEITIKAKKAVILACGGYEGDQDMQFTFNSPGLHLYPWGTPYNTGDGIKMALGINAALWHMDGLEWAAVNYKKAAEEAQFAVGVSASVAMAPDNHIFVNRFGQRFMNETKSMGHDIGHKNVTDFDATKGQYTNIPFFAVFDDTVFKAGPLCPELGRTGTRTTYYSAHQKNQWSPDNSKELAAGWIFQADTLEELAQKVKGTDFYGREYGIDPAGLVETVRKYNEYVAQSEDPEQGRDPERMAPIETPPFYAIELGLTCINTQGGPVRNKNYQTMGVDGKPIPRLYNVGELGSINGFEYVCGNIVEAHTTGRVAGQNAAKETPWG